MQSAIDPRRRPVPLKSSPARTPCSAKGSGRGKSLLARFASSEVTGPHMNSVQAIELMSMTSPTSISARSFRSLRGSAGESEHQKVRVQKCHDPRGNNSRSLRIPFTQASASARPSRRRACNASSTARDTLASAATGTTVTSARLPAGRCEARSSIRPSLPTVTICRIGATMRGLYAERPAKHQITSNDRPFGSAIAMLRAHRLAGLACSSARAAA